MNYLMMHKSITHSSQEASFQRFACRPGRYQPTCDTTHPPRCRNQTYISILPLPLAPGEPGNDRPLHRTEEEGFKARDGAFLTSFNQYYL